jgi:hypothetical protein
MSGEWFPTDEEQAAALASVMEFQRRVAPIISCHLQPHLTSGIDEFLGLVNDPEVAAKLEAWDHKGGFWRQRLVRGINEHVRQTLTISAYHHLNLKAMDDGVVHALQGMPFGQNEGIGGGDTTAMDAEYQAFILACRRCLDQLTYAVAACFKQEYDSFRTLSTDFLSKQRNRRLAGSLEYTYRSHEINFHGWLYSRTEKRSLRDRVAHRSSIRVGTLNASLGGIFFMGADIPDPSFKGRRISDVTSDLFGLLQSCVNDFSRCVSGEFLNNLEV